MQSFRSELENSIVEKDILELERKIRQFKEGQIHEEKFRSLRLARGVYGQRQPGVQMIRIKLPFGRITLQQLLRIADVSDEYSTGLLHLTTRQDIQIHYVSLDRTPQLWADLEKDEITLREACGNTVRNVTASDTAGIDPEEPFDITAYADALFRYFLRNPVCQEMGRKIKIAFSSSEKDTGLTWMHDLGFIPKIKFENGKEVRGFKVLIGGGLGAQPSLAKVAHEFLPENQLLPYTETVLRVFDRYGERANRNKARLKFLINKIGFEAFCELVNAEEKAIKNKSVEIDRSVYAETEVPAIQALPEFTIQNEIKYKDWLQTNVYKQKQEGYNAVYLHVQLGNITTAKSRELVEAIRGWVADDLRITINQNLQLRYVRTEVLPYLFQKLDELGLAEPGYNSVADITSCPGTDTCNLGISNSTHITKVLEKLIRDEYPEFVYNNDIKIKLSGCMNSCGQHGMANIGFHGSSLKAQGKVVPALQVLLGGGSLGNGEGRVADKVLKVPSKKGPDVVRQLLNDYENNAVEGEYFNNYYMRRGENYFYELLKPLTDTTALKDEDFADWGQEGQFSTAIGVGECAGVQIDLVQTLFFEAEEKLSWAKLSLNAGAWSDAIYHSYAAIISSAKALLLDKGVHCNTHNGIISDFDAHFVKEGIVKINTENFSDFILAINKQEASESFANIYNSQAADFLETISSSRQKITA